MYDEQTPANYVVSIIGYGNLSCTKALATLYDTCISLWNAPV